MRFSNPSVNNMYNYVDQTQESATYTGVALKGGYYVLLTIISAIISAFLLFNFTNIAVALIIVGGITAFVCCLIASFAPKTAPVTGSLYAVGEGLVVGALSALIGSAYSGVVFAALMATFIVFGVMMLLYATGAVKVTQKFKSIMISVLIAIVLTQLIILVAGLFSQTIWDMFYGNFALQIVISVIMIIVASLFILVDLSNITGVIDSGLPKIYEWRAALGLTITLIWLYVNFLRLFALIAGRRR